MNTKQIAVLGVVVVLIIAAVAVVITKSDDGKGNADIEASLAIGGNVNNDYKINNEDLELLDKIINGEVSADEYPLADVNGDGNINDADKAYLKKIIAGDVKSVWVTDSYGNVQEINYPLRNVIAVNADMAMFISNLGAVDCVAGFIASDYSIEQTLIRNSDAICISDGRQVKEAEYKKIADMYQIDVENVKSAIDAKDLAGDICVRKAFDLVKENAVITDVAPALDDAE